MKCHYIILLITLILISCHHNEPRNEEEAQECALNFAQNFFNFDFDNALTYCTQDSKQKMKFYVSNITRADIDSIRQIPETPTITILDVIRGANDSTASATCLLKNVYLLHAIGTPGQLVEDTVIVLPLQQENGIWKIRMEDQLQSEK